MPGVTLTLNDENDDKTVRVTVSRDAEGLRKQVDGFVKAYNDLVGFVNDQRTAATEGKTSVAREADGARPAQRPARRHSRRARRAAR